MKSVCAVVAMVLAKVAVLLAAAGAVRCQMCRKMG
jgi:hypothetical protein